MRQLFIEAHQPLADFGVAALQRVPRRRQKRRIRDER